MALVDEWVDKAEGDYQMASALHRQRKHPVPDGVCFHCQQCAEKYLKAFLVQQGINPARTHDLENLLTECTVFDAGLSSQMASATLLNQHAVETRYPGMAATVSEATDALTALRALRRAMRRKLDL